MNDILSIAAEAAAAIAKGRRFRRMLPAGAKVETHEWHVDFERHRSRDAVKVLLAAVKDLKIKRFVQWPPELSMGAKVAIATCRQVCVRAVEQYDVTRDETSYRLDILAAQ